MSKHKLLSLFLAIVMMFSCVNAQLFMANAIGNPTFTVSSGTGNPGEDVTLTIDISNNPGICTATIWVHYDEGLKLKSATDSRLLVGGLFGGNKNENPYGLGWDDSANFDGDNSSNGTLATLVFTIDPSAAAGDYDVWVTYNYGDIYNLDLEDFDFDTVAGKITVKGAACEHKNTEVRDAVSGSCVEAGYTGDTWCKDCNTKIADGEVIPATGNHVDADGKWESNGTQHFNTCSCGAEFDKTNHSGGTATCKVQANCAICGTAYGELNDKNHVNTEIRDAATESCNEAGYTGDTWCKDCNTKVADGESVPATEKHIDADGKWESDGRRHFRTCSCGNTFDYADHFGGIATCKEKAICSVCGTAYGNYSSHQLIHHERVEPDYENDGNIEYWTCSTCDKYFSDSNSNTEITADDVIIEKISIKEYQFIDGEVIIEAPSNMMPDGTYFDIQKIVPPPAEIVEKVKDQRGESSEALAYYEIRLINEKGENIVHFNDDITIKTRMPEKNVGSNCVNILQEDENGMLIEMDTWWEGEYLCYKTNWLEIYQ